MKALTAEIKKNSAQDFYKIKIEPNVEPTIFDSKIGGVGYWTAGKDYPVDERGHKMFLLAQINFAQFDFKPPLPSKGLLQFFIADNDLFGADYDNPTEQKNFRVVYHEELESVDVSKLEIPSTEAGEFLPVYDEYKISFSAGKTFITPHDFRFNDVLQKALNDGELPDEDYQTLREELEPDCPCHQLLGYPFFTQEDPRYNENFSQYDTLLFQLDSEGEYVLWGDMGVGNFFIRRQDLIDKNFERVLYNWDCC